MKTSILTLAAIVISLLLTSFAKAASDIAITQTINKRVFKIGDTLKLTIHVTNKGPDMSRDVDIYPEGDALGLVSEIADQCWSGPVGGTNSGPSPDGDVCEFLQGIPAGQTYNVTVQYRVNGSPSGDPGDDYIVTSYNAGDGDVIDPNPANDYGISVFR